MLLPSRASSVLERLDDEYVDLDDQETSLCSPVFIISAKILRNRIIIFAEKYQPLSLLHIIKSFEVHFFARDLPSYRHHPLSLNVQYGSYRLFLYSFFPRGRR
jgi:hypothetical protein